MQPLFPPSDQQASAVPFRRTESGYEVCLITSISSGRWGFPKGLIDPGETARQTALKEAQEEAGLRGNIVGEPLGEYQYAKWGVMLTVTVYLMEVTAVEESWLEADRRQRRWVAIESAAAMLDRRYLARMLRLAVERLRSER
ncbi:MAG TPA: NUDIX hydrolase [Pirellulales bacterium]|nr:NUDIX hydrolase [Pirellulales bacterium]